MMGSGNSRTVVVNASDLPPKVSHTEERQSSVSETTSVPDNGLSVTDGDQTEVQNGREANEEIQSENSTGSTDQSNGQPQCGIPQSLNPTSSTQPMSFRNEQDDLVRRNASDNWYGGSPYSSERGPPNYRDLYPEEEDSGEETENGDSILSNRELRYDPMGENRNSELDRLSAMGYSRSKTLPNMEGSDEDQTFPNMEGSDEDQTFPNMDGSDEDQTFPNMDGPDEDQTFPNMDGSDEVETPPNMDGSDKGGCDVGMVLPEEDGSNNITVENMVLKKTNDVDVSMKRSKRVTRRKMKLKKHRMASDSQIEELSVIPHDYPPPRPSKTRKADITSMELYQESDRRARQVKPQTSETIDELLDEITVGMTNEVQKVRAILMWIWYSENTDFSFRPDKNSPLGYLKRLQSGTISYSELFTLLYRKADIPCVLVDGFAKSDGYDVGKESLTNLSNTWTAVYVAGGWRLVLPLWVITNEAGLLQQSSNFSFVFLISEEKWTVYDLLYREAFNINVSDVYAVRGIFNINELDEGEDSTEEMDDDGVNEFFFLTDPEEFIYRCFPVKPEWQLLQNSFSKERFKRLPYVSSRFFDSYIQFPLFQDGTIHTSNGYCKLNITLKEGREEDAKLITIMTFDKNISDQDLPAEVQLEKYVAIIHNNKTRRVNIRLPCNGVYRLKLSDSKRGWLCSFLIVCENSSLIKNAFPEHPMLDFGPCISTLDAGLVPSSHIGGVIHIHTNQDTIVLFDTTEELLIKTKLFDHKSEVQNCVTHCKQDNELKVTVKVPVTGEYTLVILSRDKHSNKPYSVACNYLLTTENVQTRNRSWENPDKKKARERLVFVTQGSNNLEVLQQALKAYQMLNLKSKGEVGPATEKLNFLKIKQELTEGIKRKNRQLLLNSIEKAQACGTYKSELLPSIREAETFLQNMSAPSPRHNVLSMGRQTVSEISRYKKPRPLVRNIMTATMILLGESPSDVEHWSNIQKYMKKSGKNGFLNKIKRFEISRVSVDEAEKAYKLVGRYDRESAIGGGSAGAGTFYVWVTGVTERVLGLEDK